MRQMNGLGMVVAGMGIALGGYAHAQTEAAEPDTPEITEVVVTASRRDVPLREAPLSATVLTETFIQDARIHSLRDIDDYVPNVQFNQIGQVGGTYITIRGIESNPFIVNRAAVYIDGIPFRQPNDQALGFAEQIEVLRGPQGTLYGANTESGLILVTTRQPSERFEAEATTSLFGFGEGKGVQGRLSVAGPLFPHTLSGSLVLSYDKADSYVRNLASSIGEEGEIENTFIQGKLRWTPNDRVRIDAVAYSAELDAPGLYEQEFLPMNRAVYDAAYSAGFNGGHTSDKYTVFHDAPKYSRSKEHVFGANLRYRFDVATLDISGSWRQVEDTSLGTDLDLTALPGAAGGHAIEDEHTNFEARLSSPEGAAWQWVGGLNHYRSTQSKALSTLIGPGALDNYGWAPEQTNRSRDTAAFAQVTLPLAQTVRLTGGLRYEQAEREKNQAAGALDLGALGSFVYETENLSERFDALLPRLSLDWKPSENLMVYASAARGWIPGGFNLAAASLSSARDYSRYESETLWTYESGAKLTLCGGKGLLSGAVFHTEADNWQEYTVLFNPDGTVASTTMVTADASIRSRGFEAELTARPSARLDLVASLGVVDAEYTDYRPGLDDFTGKRVKLVPEWDASLAVNWRPAGGWFLRGEANGVGKTALRADGAANQKAYWLLNAQVGWKTDNWSVRLYADNLTDEYVFVSSAYPNSLFGNDGTYYAGVGNPRVIGIELGVQW